MWILVECAVVVALALGAWRVARRSPRSTLSALARLLAAMLVARLAAGAAFAVARATSTNVVAAALAAVAAGAAVWGGAALLARRRAPPSRPAGRAAVASAACAVVWLAAHVAAVAVALNAVAVVSVGARAAIAQRTVLARRLLLESPVDAAGAPLGRAFGLGAVGAQVAAAGDLIALPARTRARLAETVPALQRLAEMPSIAAAVADPDLLDLIGRVAGGSPTALWALGEHPLVVAVAEDPAVREAIAALDLVAIRDAALALPAEDERGAEIAWRWTPLASTLALDAALANDARWRPVDGAVAWPGPSRWAAARADVDLGDGDRLTLRVRTDARATLLVDDEPVAAKRGAWIVAGRGRRRLVLLLDGGAVARVAALSAARDAPR